MKERRSFRPAGFAPTEARLRPPSRPEGLVHRGALVDRLLEGPATGVVLVTAPAGYGKTVLASQWAEEDPRPFAWLTADTADNDPNVLITYLMLALHRIEPVSPELLAAVAAVDDADGVLLDDIRPRLTRMLRHRRPFVLVVDAVDALSKAGAIDVLRVIGENLGPRCQLALVGRVAPAVDWSALAARDRLVQMGVEDLRLTQAEALALVEGTGITMSQADIDAVFARTEGWAAGMYLAILSLDTYAQPTGSRSLVAGSDTLIADYLQEEVLARLAPADQTFLLRTSVLDELTGPLCDAVLATTSSAAVLRRLAASNVLVVRAERGDGEWYRLYPLLREALQATLRRREPGNLSVLQGRASQWLEAHGDVAAAIDHAIAAHDTDRAARLIWSEVPRCLANGDGGRVEEWLDSFTPRQIARYAKLALAMAWCELQRGRPADHWLPLAEQGRYEADREGESASVVSATALLRAVVGRNGVRQMGADARLALDLQPPDDAWLCAAQLLAALSSYLTGGGDEARSDLERVERLAQVTESHQFRALALSQLTLLAADVDDWTSAHAYSDQAAAIMSEHHLDGVSLLAPAHCAAALVAVQADDVATANAVVAHAHHVVALAVEAPTWNSVQCREMLARAELAMGNTSTARALLSDAQTLVNEVGDDVLSDRIELTWRRVAAHPLDVRSGSTLTRAEMRVLQLLPTHLSFGQIGERLFVSRNTVKTQAVSAYRKLGVNSRREAVERGVALGLIVPAQRSP